MSRLNFKCSKCGNTETLEQLTKGYNVTNVVGVTIDGGLLCSGSGFESYDNRDSRYRCGKCKEVIYFGIKNSPEEVIEELTKGVQYDS